MTLIIDLATLSQIAHALNAAGWFLTGAAVAQLPAMLAQAGGDKPAAPSDPLYEPDHDLANRSADRS